MPMRTRKMSAKQKKYTKSKAATKMLKEAIKKEPVPHRMYDAPHTKGSPTKAIWDVGVAELQISEELKKLNNPRLRDKAYQRLETYINKLRKAMDRMYEMKPMEKGEKVKLEKPPETH